MTIISGNGTSLTHATGQGYESPGIDESPPSGLPDFTEYDLKLMDDDGNERYAYYLYDNDIEMHHWSTNIGDADWAGDADDIYVRFYLSKGYKARNGDDDWVRVGSEEIKKGNLNVGAIKHEWTTLDLHEYYDNGYLVHDGVYNIVVCIDREHDTDNGDGKVPEIHKSNNCTSEAVFIFQESPIQPAERHALVALYDSTNGPGWTNRTGWKTESDPGTWSGVVCSNGHVKGLWLLDNQLSGTIPLEIGNLTNLDYLYLSLNQLTGSIPPEIGDLVNLTHLILVDNQLTALPPNLPRTMGYLSVNNNNLTFESLEPYIPSPFNYFTYSPQASVPVSPNAVSLRQGQRLSLPVNVGGSANRYQWFKDGVAMSSLSTSPAYSKANASVSDSGTYVCQITNTIVTDLTLTTENITVQVTVGPPIVSTTPVSSITASRAASGGNVTADGGATVTARGVCWSTSANPTTANSKTTNRTGTGSFSSSMTGLAPGTPYHVRAYATNSYGTGYGSDVLFTTAAETPTSVFHVSPGGNCGTSSPCYATIQAAIDAAEDGTLIKLKEGVYKEALVKSTAGRVTISGGWNDTFTSQIGSSSMYAPKATGGGIVKVLPNVIFPSRR